MLNSLANSHRSKVIFYLVTSHTYGTAIRALIIASTFKQAITMNNLHAFLFVSHIIVGSMALLLFWIPLFTAKGGLDHRKFGGYYLKTMYAVAATGAIMAIIVIADPIGIKGHQLSNPENTERFVLQVRLFWGFLLHLSLITFVSVRHAITVLRHKSNPLSLKQAHYILPLVLLFISGIGFIILGMSFGKVLHMIFGILGVFISLGMLRYCVRTTNKPKAWLAEHISATIGSGIGAYTAFISFGARHLLENLGSYQIVFWVAPGIIGSIAIALLSRKHVTNNVSPTSR